MGPHGGADKKEFLKDAVLHAKIYAHEDNALNAKEIFDHARIVHDRNYKFFYNIDVLLSYKTKDRVVLNSTPDWAFALKRPLTDLLIKDEDLLGGKEGAFAKRNNIVVNSILDYLDRTIAFLKAESDADNSRVIEWLSSLKDRGAVSFEEALQRLLFVNQLFWQTPHNLIGLGRMDYLLGSLYEQDLASGALTKEQAFEDLRQFFQIMHKYYWYKSGALLGDTGQICIVGGKQPDGSYFCNDLTTMLIDAVRELQLPDPKILLRTADGMPKEVMEHALDCIATGIGCPLLSNDEKVIPAMVAFGYEEADCYNYVTSACWEPLIPAKAHEQNNLVDIHYLLPLFFMSNDGLMNNESCPTYDVFLRKLMERIDTLCEFVCNDLDSLKWDEDPLMSAFTESCRSGKTDIALGGGLYNNFGVLSLGMGNLVNSVLNIKALVYDQRRYTLEQLDEARKANFDGYDEIYKCLSNCDKSYGADSNSAIALTRQITERVQSNFLDYRNRFGGKIKFGLSSPSYIMGSHGTEASFDGRRNGDPYSTHISCDGSTSYTDLMLFASSLDYSGSRFNGNVVDFFVTPSFITDNYGKFLDLLISSLRMGVYQIQLNVTSAAKLIDAREHPELYPDLIVRVWGFSAYFVDLPDEYQDNLIRRALSSERAA